MSGDPQDTQNPEDTTVPMDAEQLFPSLPEDATEVTSVPFDLRPEFTCRPKTLEQLLRAYTDTVEHDETSFVLLVGASGQGKTFAVRGFERTLERDCPEARVLRGRARVGSPAFGTFARLILQRFGIPQGTTAAVARERIASGVAEVVPESQATEVTHLLAQLCRMPFEGSAIVAPLLSEPQRLESRMFMAMRRFLVADAAAGPIILCLENLELASPGTVNLLHYLVATLRNSPVVLLGTATHEVFLVHPSFGDSDVPLQRVDLEPLTDTQGEALLRAIGKQIDHIPEVIFEHARQLEGSPRAILEFVRLLLESEVIVRSSAKEWKVDEALLGTLQLPDSHEQLIAERMRIMPEEESDILEKAAVIGETFWLDSVVALLRVKTYYKPSDPDGPTLAEIGTAGDHTRILIARSLQALVEQEWIVEADSPGIPGEREFRFAYSSLHDSVYDGICIDDRSQYHALAAQWLDLREARSHTRYREQVAEHLEKAGDPRGAARSYQSAAEAARDAFDNGNATRLYLCALRCIGETDLAARIYLWHDLGSVYHMVGEFEAALSAFDRMLRLAWTCASRTKAAVAFNKMGRVWRHKGDPKLALDYLERAQQLFEQAEDDTGIAGSIGDIAHVLYMLGRYTEARENATIALERREALGDPRSIAHSQSSLGSIEKDLGRFDEAQVLYEKSLGIRRRIGDRVGVISALNNLAVLAYERGDYDAARSGWSEALEEAEDTGALPLQAVALTNLGELALLRGHADEARHRLGEAVQLANELDDLMLEGEATRNLALVEHSHGDSEKARELAKNAYNVAKRARIPDIEGRCLLTLGEVHSGILFDADAASTANQPGELAAGYFTDGIAILRELGHESELARGLERYGRFRIEQGAIGDGRKLLAEALAIFERLGMTEQAGKVEQMVGSL